MKILITGSTGLLGHALLKRFAPTDDVTGLSRRAPGPTLGRHLSCDLLDAAAVRAVIGALRPEVVIHTQALSDVDQCEREPALAQAMNAEAAANLVRALSGTRAGLLSLSTDYVFDGTKGAPYDEADVPRPISVYGASKLAGERISLSYPRALVVRTSTLFGEGRMNFCEHLASRLTAGETVEAFRDQVTSPTYTQDLAEAIETLVRTRAPEAVEALPIRVVHLANRGGCSRVEFAERVADLLGCSRGHIRAIAMAEQGRAARRPPCSVLTSRVAPGLIGGSLRTWDEALQAYLRQRPWRD